MKTHETHPQTQLAPEDACYDGPDGMIGAGGTRIARRMLAADDLLAAAKLLEKAEDFHANCDACAPEDAPESCALCFPYFDAARIARRVAIAKAEGTGL